MKTLYLECNMGAAGDMLMAALLELHPNPDNFIKRMNELKIPGVTLKAESSVKCGICGTHMKVSVNGVSEDEEHAHSCHTHHHHEHHHSGMHEITHIINSLNIPENVRKNALSVYQLIAEAEGHAHGKPIEQIHFHEVGTMDAVADVVGVSLLIHELAPERIISSPVCLGFGKVKCAHGILPVPAPATEYILRDIPCYGGNIEGELCTPTGAALIKYYSDEFSQMPIMRVHSCGYGMGTKDFECANCLRSVFGETDDNNECILELSCNIDDMTPEALAFAEEILFENGALDVFTTSVYMKKNRPGILLTCMCRREQRDKILEIIFKHTTTIGVRENVYSRYTLDRKTKVAETPYGDIKIKESYGWNTVRSKPEYEDLAKIAKENNLTLDEVKSLIDK